MNTTTLATALSTVFGSTLSTATNIYAKNGSTNGLISASNLASVLGVGANGFSQGGNLTSSNNLNSKPIGMYTINPSDGVPSNIPESTYGIFIGFGAGASNSWGLQLFFPTDSSYFYFRTHWSSTFHSWKQVQA